MSSSLRVMSLRVTGCSRPLMTTTREKTLTEVIVLTEEYIADRLDWIAANVPGLAGAYAEHVENDACNCCFASDFCDRAGWEHYDLIREWEDLHWMSGEDV